MRYRLAVLAFVALELAWAQGEFRIDRPVIVPAQPAPEEEDDKGPPPPPRYSGDPLTPPPRCEQLDGYFAAICNERDPCEMSLEVVNVAETALGIVAVGGVHATAANVSSIMLVSDDDGESWFEPAERIPRAAFEKVQFVDREHGFAAGAVGEPGAGHETFFFVTDDGGKTWRRFEVVAGGEERTGLIVDFLFDTPKHGYLILEKPAETDRFELYESFNGARSWSTRGLTPERPRYPGRRRRVETPNWRVEEDAEAGQYLIQGRGEESEPWTTRARFAVGLGSCP